MILWVKYRKRKVNIQRPPSPALSSAGKFAKTTPEVPSGRSYATVVMSADPDVDLPGQDSASSEKSKSNPIVVEVPLDVPQQVVVVADEADLNAHSPSL